MITPNFTNPLGASQRTGYLEATRRLKDLTRQVLKLDEDSAVTISELACRDPGCPELETIIAVLRKGEPPKFARIHKPLLEVTASDVTFGSFIRK